MSAQPSVLQVVILRDGLLVGTEVLTPGTYAIGSDPSSDLRLDDASVDARHAMLYFQNGRSAIQDAGSAQGVYVNGHRVSACEIRSVDEVLCGPFVLKTRVLSQRPAEKAGPPPEVAALLGTAPPQPRPSPPPCGPCGPRRSPPSPSPRPWPTSLSLHAPSSSSAPCPPPTRRPAWPGQRRRPRSRPLARLPPPLPCRSTGLPPPRAEAPPSPRWRSRCRCPCSRLRRPCPPTRCPPPAAGPPRSCSPSALLRPWCWRRTSSMTRCPRCPSWRCRRSSLGPRCSRSGPPPLSPSTRSPPRRWRIPPAPPMPRAWPPARARPSSTWSCTGAACAVRRAASSRASSPCAPPRTSAPPCPLWGFSLPDEGFTLAEALNGSYRLFVPPGSTVERAGKDGRFQALQASALETDGNRRFVTLSDGAAARLTPGADVAAGLRRAHAREGVRQPAERPALAVAGVPRCSSPGASGPSSP